MNEFFNLIMQTQEYLLLMISVFVLLIQPMVQKST